MIRIIPIAMITAVAACNARFPNSPAHPPAIASLEAPCPSPADRVRLDDGSTYRDLAASREEAIVGWELCHAATIRP